MGAISSALGGKVKKQAKPRAARVDNKQEGAGKQKRDLASQLAALGLPVEDV
jgi:hypothetical protein